MEIWGGGLGGNLRVNMKEKEHENVVGVYLRIVLFFSGLNPLLQQILIVWVATGAQWHGRKISKRTRIGVDEYRYQTIRFLQIVHLFANFAYSLNKAKIILGGC